MILKNKNKTFALVLKNDYSKQQIWIMTPYLSLFYDKWSKDLCISIGIGLFSMELWFGKDLENIYI
jgi:hypothetical protein